MSQAITISCIVLMLIFQVYGGIMLFFSSGLKKKRLGTISGNDVSIDILIPFCNEEEFLPECLNAWMSIIKDEPKTRLILLDDHSTDSSALFVEKIANSEPRVRLLKNTAAKGKKSAIGLGLEISEADFVLQTDADCIPERNILDEVRKSISDEVHLLAGNVSVQRNKSFLAEFQRIEFAALVGSSLGAIKNEVPFSCNGALMAYRRAAYEEVKNKIRSSNFLSGDDVFLLHAFKKEFGSCAIAVIENTKVTTRSKASFAQWFRQRLRWASKAYAYKDGMSVFISLLVIISNLALLFSFASIPLGYWYVLPLFFAMKIIPDYVLLQRSLHDNRLFVFFLSEFIFILIYPLIALLSPFYRNKW